MDVLFRWKCSYQGSTWYEVRDHTGTYEAEFRRSAPDCELARPTGDDCRRDILAAVGILRRASGWSAGDARLFEVPASTVAAFNRWRDAERAEHRARIKAAPEKYGTVKPIPGGMIGQFLHPVTGPVSAFLEHRQ